MGKYFKIFQLSFRESLKNTKALFGLSLFLITCLLIFAHIWKIAAARMGALDLQSDQLLWYIALNEWILISFPDIHDDMESDVQSGRLAYLLPRPISYLGSCFFDGLGRLFANLLILGIVSFSFAWVTAGTFPFTGTEFLTMLFLTLFAGAVVLIYQMLVGLSAFWMHRVEPLQWTWDKLLFTLGGLMLPLSIYPEWLQKVASFTPFPAILGERSALVLDFTFSHALFVAGTLFAWGLAGIGCLIVLYRKGLRIVNIEGG